METKGREDSWGDFVPVPPEFDTITVIKKVAMRAKEGDPLALDWLERHDVIKWMKVERGYAFPWNRDLMDAAFFGSFGKE